MTPADLLAARQVLGLTQQELADLLGVPQSTVWRWETGQHPIRHPAILRLALESLARRLP